MASSNGLENNYGQNGSYDTPPISMKFRQFHEAVSSSFKSMKLANGNHDSAAVFRLRVRRDDFVGGGGTEMITSSSSTAAANNTRSSSSSSLISIKSASARPSREARAPSRLMRRSAEVMDRIEAVGGGSADDGEGGVI